MATTTERDFRAGRGLAFALVCVACGGPPAGPPPAAPSSAEGPSSELERYFPAPHDSVYAYETLDEESGDVGVLMMHVTRPRPGRANLETGGRTERLSIAPDGIQYLEGGYLLKPPVETGATFVGRTGPVTVVKSDVIARVPAGTFADCVETREESRSPAASRTIESTYCRDVGLVRLRVQAATEQGLLSQEVRLRSFGPKVDLAASPAR